jgi:hypothetical protein
MHQLFNVTADEVKAYRDEHGVGLQQSKDILKKRKLIEHLEKGGTAEPVLLYLLKEWISE